MDTKQVAEKLVDFCRRGKNLDAVNTLYDKDIVSIEAQGSPEMPAEQRGIDAIRRKHQWWNENMEVHSSEVSGPFSNGDQFTVLYNYDFTPRNGPGKGKRTKMQEVGLYSLKNGKIVREQFFY